MNSDRGPAARPRPDLAEGEGGGGGSWARRGLPAAASREHTVPLRCRGRVASCSAEVTGSAEFPSPCPNVSWRPHVPRRPRKGLPWPPRGLGAGCPWPQGRPRASQAGAFSAAYGLPAYFKGRPACEAHCLRFWLDCSAEEQGYFVARQSPSSTAFRKGGGSSRNGKDHPFE